MNSRKTSHNYRTAVRPRYIYRIDCYSIFYTIFETKCKLFISGLRIQFSEYLFSFTNYVSNLYFLLSLQDWNDVVFLSVHDVLQKKSSSSSTNINTSYLNRSITVFLLYHPIYQFKSLHIPLKYYENLIYFFCQKKEVHFKVLFQRCGELNIKFHQI